MRYAIDARALLHVVEHRIETAHQLVAPTAIRTHALTILLQEGADDARELHTRLTELKLRALGDRVSRWTSNQLAEEHGWDSTYDAEYVAVAKLQADALIALDDEVRRKAEGIVPLAGIDALLAPE